MTTTTPAGRQELTIRDWHPATSANARGNWRVIHQRHRADMEMASVCARQAGWRFVPGKVLLTVVLVYPQRYRTDADNLHARVKGLVDGLKTIVSKKGPYMEWTRQPGFFTDDDTDHLELVVKAEVQRGVKETRIVLEPLERSADD